VSKFSDSIKKSVSERILAFDLLRGYFLCVILFNHLQYYPSGLDFLTGRGILYASTAEGFFVVSGIVLGIVRGRKLLAQPLKVATKLLWKRALQLYLTTIVLTLLFTVVGQLFIGNPGLKYGIFTDWGQWWTLIRDTVTLSYTYGWADFLRMYAIFIFFAPLALWFLRKGQWVAMLLISFGIWALYPFVPQVTAISQPFSWQFIFFAGFTIGFYWETILARWRALAIKTRKIIGWSFATAFVISLLGSFMLVFGHEFSGALGTHLTSLHRLVETNFDKDRLPIPRMLLGAVWFWGLFYIVRRFESWITKHFGWLLLEFGANSLYVYTISAFVVFFVHLIVIPGGFKGILPNLALSLFLLGIIHLSVKKKFLMKIIPR